MLIPFMIFISKSRHLQISMLSIILTAALVYSGSLYVTWQNDRKILLERGQPDINTLSLDQLQNGLFVSGSLDLTIDVFAEMTESDFSKFQYYLIPIYSTDAEGYITFDYFVAFRAERDQYKTMADLIEYTWSDIDKPTPLTLENARLAILPTECQAFLDEYTQADDFSEGQSFIEWCAKIGICGTPDPAVIQSKITSYMITETTGPDSALNDMYVVLGVAFVFAILLLVAIFKRRQPADPTVERAPGPAEPTDPYH